MVFMYMYFITVLVSESVLMHSRVLNQLFVFFLNPNK